MSIKLETKKQETNQNQNNLSYDVFALKRLLIEILKQAKDLNFEVEKVTETSLAIVIDRKRVLYFPKKWLDDEVEQKEHKTTKKVTKKETDDEIVDGWDDLE